MYNYTPHTETGYNISTVALRVVEGDYKGTVCLAVQFDHRVPGEHNYRDLVVRVQC
jgi:hypothetical protein